MRLGTLGLVVALALGILLLALAADAQQSTRVPRVGFLLGSSPAAAAPFTEAFRQALRDLGYVERQNIAIEERFAEGRYERFPGFAVELVRLKVDVIAAGGTPAALAAKNATRTIPIVMVSVGDPVGSGLVASLARPSGNITGTAFMSTEVKPKLLDLLKQAVPGATRVAVLWNPTPRQAGRRDSEALC